MVKQSVTLWQMLVWAYARQCVDAYLPSVDRFSARVRWLHFLLATSGDHDPENPRPKVSRDAAALHAVVLEMDEADAAVLISTAKDGLRPEACTTVPRPYPVEAERSHGRTRGQRWGWCEADGRRFDYLIRVADEILELKPIWQMAGRKRVKVIGQKTVRRRVEFCPIEWDPDPEFALFANSLRNRWVEAMERLMVAVEAVQFDEHVISGLGTDLEEATIDAPVIHDARSIDSAAQRRPVVLGDVVAPVLGFETDGVHLRFREATVRHIRIT